jgi:hypothetical protein
MKKTWSRKKINDKFANLLKQDGTPMSRQQIHMLRKKAQGICLTCGEPAIGVYCLKHTIAARERMRAKLKMLRRLQKNSARTARNGKAVKLSGTRRMTAATKMAKARK